MASIEAMSGCVTEHMMGAAQRGISKYKTRGLQR